MREDLSYSTLQKRTLHGRPSKHWYGREWDPATRKQRWVNTRCQNKRDAEAVVRRWQRDGQSTGKTTSNLTLRAAAAQWLENKRGTVTTEYVDLLTRRVRFWVSFFGDCALDAVAPEKIREYLRGRCAGTLPGVPLRRPLAARSVNDDRFAISMFFKWAVEEQLVDKNPVTASSVPRHSGERIRKRVFWLDASDEERLLRCAREVPAPVSVTAVRNAAGCRAGDSRTKPSSPLRNPPAR